MFVNIGLKFREKLNHKSFYIMQRFTLNTIERQIIKAHQLNQFNQSLQRYSSITVQPLKQKISSSKWSANPELLLSSNQVVLKAHYSQQGRPGFFASVVSNIKENFSKNKEMQESLKKFREEARQLEESDALKEARRKFESIEKETGKSSNVLKEQLGGIAGKVKESLDEVGKTEALKKAGEFTQKAGEFTQNIGQKAGSAAETLGKSDFVKTASTAAATIKEELEGGRLGGQVYRKPLQLRKRKEHSNEQTAEHIEVNEEATGVELHKDSKFYAAFQNFKENNPMFTKFVDARTKYEESDNPLARGARIVTDKVQDIFGGVFTKTELSEVLTEIVKMDPNFCKEQFLKDCEKDIIPNILEAMVHGELEVLEDWCFEAPFSILSQPIKQAKQLGYYFDSRILDIDDVDLAMGKMTEFGPVLAITFQAQQIMCVRDRQGKVMEGDPDKVMRVNYIWVLCRDQTELDPSAAWRLMELAATNQVEQFL